MRAAQITSSIRLQFHHIIEIKPWLLLHLLNEEFVSVDPEMLDFLEVVLNPNTEIGVVTFGKINGKMYEVDETYYIRFEDGRTFSFVTPALV